MIRLKLTNLFDKRRRHRSEFGPNAEEARDFIHNQQT